MTIDIRETIRAAHAALASGEKGRYRPLLDFLRRDEPFAREDQRGEAVGLAAQLVAELGEVR